MTEALVELRGVVKTYGERREVAVLRGVDLRIEPGESVAVVGPSGSGKSTLLDVIGGLLTPDQGSVRFGGRELGGLDERARAAVRNREIGFVFQAHHLLPQCTALENALIPTLSDWTAAERRAAVDRARALLDQVGLGDRLDHRPAQLSGGECQRVALVRALVAEPRLLLADEPTGSLDRAGADRLGELLAERNRRDGLTLVVVTHSERLAERLGRRLALRDGALVPDGGS